ncbi:MAG: hypothetical protein WC521_04395 [Bdellovibrionales bacterium]
MSKNELENLAKIGQLKAEAPSRDEFEGMTRSAKKRLADAQKTTLAPESRFDLAYNAAHGFALAALRREGYRSENRFLVFQCLSHTVDGIEQADVRIFSKCHDARNLAEYEGYTEVDERLLAELIKCTVELERVVLRLAPPPG